MSAKPDQEPPARHGVGGEDEAGPAREKLPPAARRALDEARARRKAADRKNPIPAEIGGPDGPEPTRYGDWEIGGIASDF